MNERLLQFLAAENISQSQFADTLGITRASVSHVLAGRNRPSYDFLESLMIHYPSLNIEWLVQGKGKMYKRDQEAATVPSEPDLFSSPAPQEMIPNPVPASDPLPEPSEEPARELSAGKTKIASVSLSERPEGTRISKIIVFFSDNTFQELS